MYIEFKRGLESSSLDFLKFFLLEITGSIYRDGAILWFFWHLDFFLAWNQVASCGKTEVLLNQSKCCFSVQNRTYTIQTDDIN